ncbi:hypothetical protein N8I77_006922 [Diaporthe amygdali]|uniref:Uncharacterized protein n=1 Tax=Phomopsis amygdali TaxID=1214568 RepID=A0AAD9W536_PHOAM|nr:hypothetical protein N8I77_006922 [Diaporthe amygdali]
MSLAAFRRHNQHDELAQLAESHFQHDLTTDDRKVLKGAAKTISWHASLGSIVGLGLGCFLAYRVRGLRRSWFNEFRTSDQPKQVIFQSGKTLDVPDVTSKLAPSPVGDFAAYFFLGMGGLFLGGETGFLTGSSIAARRVRADAERRKRVEDAYRAFKIDLLQKEVKALQQGGAVW